MYAIFHPRRAILIQKQIQQPNHLQGCKQREGFATRLQPNEAVLERLLSQWKEDVQTELFDSFSL